MNEKQKLLDALKEAEGTPADWKNSARVALEDEELRFAGNDDPGAYGTAGDLSRIYSIRLQHCKNRGIEAHGIAELVESLTARARGDVIEGQPFLGPRSSVGAFWDATGHLIGCVTIFERDSGRGQRNLDFVLGKR